MNLASIRLPRGLALAACLGVAGLSACASPREYPELRTAAGAPQEAQGPQDGDVALGLGAGVTAGPETFLVGAQLDYFLGNHLSIGPGVHAGLSGDDTLLATTFHVRWLAQLGDTGDLSRVHPYFQAGAGFLYAEEERRNRSDRDDIGVLLQGGVGIDFAATDDVSFGTAVMLNFMPSAVLGDHSYVSWEVLRVGLRF